MSSEKSKNSQRRRRVASYTLSDASQQHIGETAKKLAGNSRPNGSKALEAIIQHHKSCKFGAGEL